MQQEIYEVVRDRFHLLKENLYILQGYWPKEYQAEAFLDKKQIPAEIKVWEHVSALERFKDLDKSAGQNITMAVTLPETLGGYRKLYVYGRKGNRRFLWFTVSARELERRRGRPEYFMEEEQVDVQENVVRLRGWAIWKKPVKIIVCDEKHQKISANVQRMNRSDVSEIFKEVEEEQKSGFYLEFPKPEGKVCYLLFGADGGKAVYPVVLSRDQILRKKLERYWKKGTRYLKSHGAPALAAKVTKKVFGKNQRPVDYREWLPKHLPDARELEEQRKKEKEFSCRPKISVIVPLYRTPENYLDEMIRSVQRQTYTNWELCLSDGSGKDSPIREKLEQYVRQDARIRCVFHEETLRISENTNAALAMAEGDFIAFMDHDDVLTEHALYECVRKINEEPDTEILYSDEDKMSMDGHKFFQPHFKPDFNPDLLRTVNYICHLFVVKKELQERVGGLRREYDGAQDYDFVLRCTESTTKICHIPKILYHWRSHENSTAENPESKTYAFDAGRRAVEEHYRRLGIPATVEMGEFPGLYRTHYHWQEKPLISIIIPNKDHIDDLERCIESIDSKSTYRNYEYVIVENNSTDDATFRYYERLEQEKTNVRVIYYKGAFNFSDIMNYGAASAKGSYYLLLNNDTEIINPECLEEMLGYCMRPDVGAVGARLYYEDDTIQHAGVVIGFGGIAGHCFVLQPRGSTGYFHRIICAQDYSAVTAACMMVPREVFDAVQGFSTELAVAFNDIDFCLKVRSIGKLIVYNPYAELHHYESKSRGLEDTPEKVARFNREIAVFEKRWPEILRDGDPYYNPNLTLDSQDFSLRRI